MTFKAGRIVELPANGCGIYTITILINGIFMLCVCSDVESMVFLCCVFVATWDQWYVYVVCL